MVFNSDFTENITSDEWPSNPTRNNYLFLGWYTNRTSGVEVFNYDNITSNTTLYAHWTTNEEDFITLTNTVTGESVRVLSGSDWTFTGSKFDKDLNEKLGTVTFKFNATGYPDEVKDFNRVSTPSGFYVNNDTSTLYNANEAYQFTEDTNITPYYDENDISYDNHIGLDLFDYDITNGDKEIKCFSKTNQTDPYDKDEYTCYTEYDEEDGNVTVYLHWKEIKKISVTEPDGTVNIYDEGDTYNTGVNNSAKDSVGYTVTFKYQDGETEDTTQSHATTYTANGWLINGNHVDDNTDITLEEDIVKIYDYTEVSTTITLPEPTKEDYTFRGWNSKTNGKGTTYTNESINSLDKDTTVYGIWGKDEITLSFNSNGGEAVEDIIVNYDTEVGDLPTTSKDSYRSGDNLIGYIFDGWYRDSAFTSKVSSASKFTEDTTLYAKFIETDWVPVYPKVEESFVCTGSNYIDTGVQLYTETNNDYQKDYEVGFTIESYNPSEQVKQAVFFNDKYENTSEKWPGIVFRRSDTTNNLEITQSINNGSKVAQIINDYTLPLEVKIYRIDHIIYYSTDGGVTKTALQDMSAFNQFFDINATFCAGDNGSGGVQRYLKGTISNYYITMGNYPGTLDEQETHTVTYPDGSVETYYHNTIIDLESNESTKANENGAKVTFNYNDGVTSNLERYVTKEFTPNGFTINNVHYDNESTLVVDEDKVITYDYDSNNIEVEFPSDPVIEHYTFDGWYDEDDNKVEIYDDDEDIILYAHYTEEKINICINETCEEVSYGSEYTIPSDIPKEDDFYSTVTFKYHNGEDDTTSNVLISYSQDGFKDENDNRYSSGDTITVEESLNLEPVYVETIIPASFPSDPLYENHEFTGWFTEEDGGTLINSYDGNRDIDIHAQWNITLPTDFDVDSEDITIVKGEIYQIIVSFTPEGTEDVLTFDDYSDIINIDNNGLVTGVTEGNTTITVGTENTDISKTINVTVLNNEITSQVYDVTTKDLTGEDIKIIIGAEPETSIKDFLDNIDNDNEYLVVYNKNDAIVSVDDYEDTLITTGARIKLIIDDHEYDEVRVIVRGDFDEDGYADVSDGVIIQNHILRKQFIEGYKLYAADLDEDSEATIDEMIDVTDGYLLDMYILRKINSLNEKDGE